MLISGCCLSFGGSVISQGCLFQWEVVGGRREGGESELKEAC